MADELKMNFAAMKRVDPYAKSLLETAAHVALYTFANNEWDKTDIEGALFVYSRTAEPFHNVLIMNRLNMKNLVEPVTQGMDLQLQEPFLLYRTPQGTIFGIWFYDKDECVKIAGTLARIIRESAEVRSQRKNKASMEPSSVDIFSMLTKAQEEFNSKSPRKTQPGVQVLELNMNSSKENDSTPKSVIDFFAKASNGNKFSKDSTTPATIIQPPGMFMSSPRAGPPPGLPRMSSVPITIPPQQQNDVRPFLQRLMSNPANTVEHIEKQQQAVTPQTEMAGMIRNGNHILSSSHNSDHNNSLSFNMKSNTSVEDSIGNSEKPVGFLRIVDSPTNSQVVTQQFFNSNLVQKHSPLINDSILESTMKSESHRPLSAPMESQIKPALMPPVMFTSSVKKDSESDIANIPLSTLNAAGSYQVQPEPLTKNQLLQAVNYLLKHDPDFMTKLHEAYVKSFSELVS